jgi:hypothetical protein
MKKFGKRGRSMEPGTSCLLPFATRPRDIFPRRDGLESSGNLGAVLSDSEQQNGSAYFSEVQISLDFNGGQRSIVTFRFSAGDTMMRARIYASRGM